MEYKIASEKRKREIADCFKNILQKKSFSKVTVSEIIAACGINRKTFYYHFEDIYSLLKWTLEQEAFDIVKHFDLLIEYEDAIRFVMDYIEENESFLNNIYNSVGRDELKRFFYMDFINIIRTIIDRVEEMEHLSVPEDFKLFLERFYTEATAGILLEWITDRTIRNREQTICYISMLFRSTIPGILHEYQSM